MITKKKRDLANTPKRNANKDPFDFHEEITLEIGDRKFFVAEVDRTSRGVGGRYDGPTLARLKTALFVETYLTFRILQCLDIRSTQPDLYFGAALRGPDERERRAREDDARNFLGENIGMFSLNTCLDEGRKRAPAWFNSSAADLAHYMEGRHLARARQGMIFNEVPGHEIDLAIARQEKEKIDSLLYAIDRSHELRELQKHRVNQANRKRRRPQLAKLNAFEGEKYPFPHPDFAYLIAHHAAIDPTATLWPTLREYSNFYRFVAWQSKDFRGQDIDAQEARAVATHILPYLDGTRLPQDAGELYFCRQIGAQMSVDATFRRAYGCRWTGPRG